MNSHTPIDLKQAEAVDSGREPVTHWQALTRQANAALEQGHGEQAEALYHEAMTLAEALFQPTDQMAEGIGAIYTISCHNLAELYHQRNDCTQAGRYHQQAFDRMLQATHAPDAPLEFRANCVTHLKHAAVELVTWMQTCSGATPDQIAAVIADARAASERASRALRRADALNGCGDTSQPKLKPV